jgi:hypothetical protein
MGDDYYDLPADASNADRLQYSRIVTRNLLDYISTSHNQKKRALDQRWSDGEIDSPKREAILATLNETTEALRYDVRSSGYEGMVKEELLVFAQQMITGTQSSYDTVDVYGAGADYGMDNSGSPLADALEYCTPYTEDFQHEMTGEWMTRQVAPRPAGCAYQETMPGGYRMNCLWTRQDDLLEIAAYYRDASRFDDARVVGQTEFVDGQPVSRTSYIINGVAVENPMQASVESGACAVARQ